MTPLCFKVVPYDCVWYTRINQILLSFAFPNLIRIMACPFVSIREKVRLSILLFRIVFIKVPYQNVPIAKRVETMIRISSTHRTNQNNVLHTFFFGCKHNLWHSKLWKFRWLLCCMCQWHLFIFHLYRSDSSARSNQPG